MTFLVDTSVWSIALRRDNVPAVPHVGMLRHALEGGATVVATGLILQELLQGILPDRSRAGVVERFRAIALVQPSREEHVAAADLRNRCRAKGVQIGTIDAVIAQICIARRLTLLSADRDFEHAARVIDLPLWMPQRQ